MPTPTLAGALTIAAGSNVTVTPSGGNTLTIASTGGGGGSYTLLEEHTASTSTDIQFTARNVAGQSGASFQADYDTYVFELVNVTPTTNNSDLWLRFSTNGGTSYDSTAGHYSWVMWRVVFNATGVSGSQSDTQIGVSGNLATISNVLANAGVCGTLKLFNPQSATFSKKMTGQFNYLANTGFNDVVLSLSASYLQTAAVNACQFRATSGTVATGTIRLYGIAK